LGQHIVLPSLQVSQQIASLLIGFGFLRRTGNRIGQDFGPRARTTGSASARFVQRRLNTAEAILIHESGWSPIQPRPNASGHTIAIDWNRCRS